MADENDKTLETYDGHVQDYVAGTHHDVSGDLKEWLDNFLAQLPEGTEILEIGSGFGRDADYIESKGFKVRRTDGSQGFVDYLRQQGHHADLVNLLKDDMPSGVQAVLAQAVFLHFTEQELQAVLQKVFHSLAPGGLLAFSMKEGAGEAWTDAKLGAPRYFRYWQEAELREMVDAAGFKTLSISRYTSRSADWLQVIAKK